MIPNPRISPNNPSFPNHNLLFLKLYPCPPVRLFRGRCASVWPWSTCSFAWFLGIFFRACTNVRVASEIFICTICTSVVHAHIPPNVLTQFFPFTWHECCDSLPRSRLPSIAQCTSALRKSTRTCDRKRWAFRLTRLRGELESFCSAYGYFCFFFVFFFGDCYLFVIVFICLPGAIDSFLPYVRIIPVPLLRACLANNGPCRISEEVLPDLVSVQGFIIIVFSTKIVGRETTILKSPTNLKISRWNSAISIYVWFATPKFRYHDFWTEKPWISGPNKPCQTGP